MKMLRQPLNLLCILVSLGFLSGCQIGATRPPVVEPNGTPLPNVIALQQDFLLEPDVAERYLRVSELEAQALALLGDEPLRLGSVGSAILEIYPASYTGHFVLEKFYRNLESTEAQQFHTAWLRHLRNSITLDAKGTAEAPYRIFSINDAKTLLARQGLIE